MCPTIGLEAELELERGKRALQAGSPADVLAMAMKLWRLTITQLVPQLPRTGPAAVADAHPEA